MGAMVKRSSEEVVRELRAASERRHQMARRRRATASLCAVASIAGVAAGVAANRALWESADLEEVTVVAAPVPPAAKPEPRYDRAAETARLERVTKQLRAMGRTQVRLPAARVAGLDCGYLSKAAVVGGMNGVKRRIARCASAAPSMAGMAMATVVIDKGGRISSASVTGKFGNTAMGRCVEAAVTTAWFPPSEGLTTQYPFQIKGGDSFTLAREALESLNDADPLTAREVFDRNVRTVCAAPEGIDDCTPEAFEDTFEMFRPLFHDDLRDLEERWQQRFRDGDSVAAYGLAWLGDPRALREVHRQRLARRAREEQLVRACPRWHPPPRAHRTYRAFDNYLD
jgi:hypothetical protein